MGYFRPGLIKVIATAFIVTGVAALALLAGPVVFPRLPAPSETFDCDDGALAMYRHFRDAGIEARPVIGNLELDDEGYLDCNHVWLLVRFGEHEIAYDWGLPRLDSQHYQGYEISLDELLAAVAADNAGNGQVAAAR